MKQLNEYLINKQTKEKIQYKYYPKDKDELMEIISEKTKKEGLKCDLNDIDVSKIKDMCRLFNNSPFNGDISKWDVSNVENMDSMFYNSKFNGDISKWNICNVENMNSMFSFSKFNGDISQWDVSNVENMDNIFYECPLKKNPPEWYND